MAQLVLSHLISALLECLRKLYIYFFIYAINIDVFFIITKLYDIMSLGNYTLGDGNLQT